jgi:choline kinase
MKAIILAAGIGRRLAAAGWDMPKCLLPFGDTTLIDNMLKSLTDNGIKEAAIVVGYKKESVKKAVSAYPLKLTFFENPDYENTNTINSLWRAAEFADDDIVYFNADILFDRRIVGHQR